MMIKHVLDKLNKNQIGNVNGLFEEKYSHFKKDLLSNANIMIDSTAIKGFTL